MRRSEQRTALRCGVVILCLVLAGCDKFVDVRGTVRDSRGEVVAGAKIHLTNSDKYWYTESHSDGCFIDGGAVDPMASSEPLTVVAAGYKPASLSVPMARFHHQVIVNLVPSDSAGASRIQILASSNDSKNLASCDESK
jgi:hypothetical protein